MSPKTRIAAIVALWRTLFWDCPPHAFPIVMTVLFLVPHGRNMYWKDADYDYVDPIIPSLQFLAKFHEICMGFSLAEIVLDCVCSGLRSSNGLPLGLVTAAYQVSSLTFFASSEFWASCRLSSSKRATVSRLALLGLIFIVFLLTLVMGPCSAVVIIPNLDWWDHTNPFPEGPERAFMRYKPYDLWPTSITKDLIPPGCADTKSPDAEYCPYSGYELVKEWVSAHQNQGQEPNITTLGHGGVTRHLASVTAYPGSKSRGETSTSTIGYKEAWDLGAFWQYALGQGRSLATPSRPRIAPGFVNGSPLKKPEVRIICVEQYEWSTSDFALPQHEFTLTNDLWWIPSSILQSQQKFRGLFSNTTDGIQSHVGQFPTAFTWVDTSNLVDGPSIGAVIAVNTPNESVALVTCSVSAYWKPTTIFLDPKSDMIVHEESSTRPNEYDQGQWDLGTPINIAVDWADAMDRNFTDDNGLETTYIQHMMERYNNNSSSPVIFSEPGFGQESIPWRISTALGLYLTEALARVQSTFWNGTVLCHANKTDQESVFILGNLNGDDSQWWPEDKSFIDYAHEQGWAELNFAIARYGYGWGFQGKTVKLATAALVLQAVIGIVYIGLIVSGIWKPSSWATMGEMLIFAINSSPSTVLRTAATPVDKHTWRQTVKIRQMENKHPELVVEGETNVELMARMGQKHR